MAVGGGFAVGVTVVPVDAAPSPWAQVDPEPPPVQRLGVWLPRRRSSSASAGLMQQVTSAEAKLAALKLELALDIAADRPAPVDPRPGEARAAGVGPGGVSEFVQDGVTGLMTEPDPAALAETFDRLHADRTLAARLGAAAGAHVAELGIDWDVVVEKLLA